MNLSDFPQKKQGLWLANPAVLPIRSLVFGGKQLELMSWLRISEKTAFLVEPVTVQILVSFSKVETSYMAMVQNIATTI